MRTRLLLALALALPPLSSARGADSPTFTPTPIPNTTNPAPESAPSQAAKPAPEPVGNFTAVDALIADVSNAVSKLQNCMKLTDLHKADLAKKQRELKAEFGGKIPPAFSELLEVKRKRADKQQFTCAQDAPRTSQLYLQAHETLRSFEPKSLPGIAARDKKLNAVKARFNQLFPSAKVRQE